MVILSLSTGFNLGCRPAGSWVFFFFLGNGMPAPRLPVLPHAHSHPQPHPYHQWGHPVPHCRCLPVNPCTAWEREKCRLAIMEDAPGQMVPTELGTWVLVLSTCGQWGQWQVLGQNYVVLSILISSGHHCSLHQGRLKKGSLFLLRPPLGLSRTLSCLNCHTDTLGWYLKPSAQVPLLGTG